MGGGWGRGAYNTSPPPPPPPKKKKQQNYPAAKFTSQGDAHVRTDAQIKFLYYPQASVTLCKQRTSITSTTK